MSPRRRTRTATARPWCSRKTRSISGAAGDVMRSSLGVVERPDLDRDGGRRDQLAPPLQRGVQVGDVDDREAADVLLALGERSVDHEDVAVLRPQRGGGARRAQPAAEDPNPPRPHLLVEGGPVLHYLVPL